MSKGHNKGKNREKQSDSKDTNVPGQNHHLKKSQQEDSPNRGRNKDDMKKDSNNI